MHEMAISLLPKFAGPEVAKRLGNAKNMRFDKEAWDDKRLAVMEEIVCQSLS